MSLNMLFKVLWFSIAGVLILWLFSCDLVGPNTEGMTTSCRACFECMYYNQKNPDKTICASLCSGCKSSNDFRECIELKHGMDMRDCLLQMKK